MAADGSEPQQESYAHMFVDSFGDLEAFEHTVANQEAAEEDNQVEQEEEQPTAEYDGGNSDAESSTTIPPVDQWIHENADVLNQDEYGFGLEQDIDEDDIRLFDEAGLQPDGFGMIPWDVAIKDPARRDDGKDELPEDLARELEHHYAAGHVPKNPNCPICQRADGPVRQHRSTPSELRNTGVLTVDLMGPFTVSYPRRYKYAMVGAFRGRLSDTGAPAPLFPVSIPLKSKEGKYVAEAIRTSILFIESLHTGMYAEGKRVHSVLSDKGSEFENKDVVEMLADLAVFQSFTSGYSPQSSGSAEVNVRIVKQVMRRLLESASLKAIWWSHALEYTTQLLQCKTLSRVWEMPAFGEYVAVKILTDKKKLGTFTPRGELGRLLVVRPMTDRTCEILVGTRIVKGTTPRPVSDKLAEAMTKEERRQVLEEVRTELDEEVKNFWEPVLTPMGNLMWVNKVHNYAQFRTPQFVRVGSKEPETDEQPIAAAIQLGTSNVPAVVSFPATKTAKKHLKNCMQSVSSKLLPQNQARTNLFTSEKGYPRSVTIGLTVARGYGIAHQTPYFAETLAHVHMLAGTRPVGERDPYLSVQINHLGDMCSMKLHYDSRNDADCSSWVISDGIYTGGQLWVEHPNGTECPPPELWRTPDDGNLRGYLYDTLHTWVKLPARHCLHGVTPVKGTRVSLSYYVPRFLCTLDVSLAYTLVQLGFPVEQWLKQYPDSIYNVSKDTFQVLVKEFPTVETGESRGASCIEIETPLALAVQELQVLPKDVDKHFGELAKAHPISMKAVRNTDGKEREKWKESTGKELKGLVDRETYDEVSASDVPLSQVQNAPARMVYVVKPAIDDDGTRFVKRKSRLVICGNFLNPYGETSTANLDISVLRTLISVGLTNKWRFASADIPQAFLYASIEQGRNVYLKPPKICVDFGLVGKDTLCRLKRALYGLRESPKLWEKERDEVLSNMKLQHPKLGQLKLVQSQVHSSLWLIMKDDDFTRKKGLKVRFKHAATTVEDQNVEQEFELTNLQFGIPIALMAVYVDDLLVAAPLDVVTSIQTSVDNQWKTGPFQVLGEKGCDELVYLGTQIEYEPGCKDKNVILLHQERYTYELMEKFPEYFNDVRQRAVPGSSEGFKDMAEPVDAPLSVNEQSGKVLMAEETKLVKHLQSIGGSVLWLVIRTRPDMAWAYSRIASLITRHPKAAVTRMKELCRYLVYTGPMAMKYRAVSTKESNPLDVYADISFAPQGQTSHEGMIVLWGTNVLCWKSGRQSLTATSTSEAELFGASHAGESLKAMHLVLSEMLGTCRTAMEPCGRVWCDNQSAISQILAGSSSNLKTRHVSIKANRLGEDVKHGYVDLAYVQTDDQKSDCLTKAYTKPLMNRCYEHLGLSSLYAQEEKSTA